MVPIWKDYFISYGDAYPFFRIIADAADGPVLYSWKKALKPGASTYTFKINDICANHLMHQDIAFSSSVNQTRVSRIFIVQCSISGTGGWVSFPSVEFQNDWSYDYDYNTERDGLQFPVSLFADGRQRILRTVLSGASITATLAFKDGTTLDVALTVHRSDDFNVDYNNDYSRTAESFPGVAMLDLADYPDVASVTIGGITWNVLSSGCYRYALYYINAYGGWDTLLCRGNGMEADSWKRHDFSKAYSNREEQNRGAVDYLKEQSKRWTLRTGWLDDIGASRMHNLMGSVMVYLHDLKEDRILPVCITTTDAPYKTYMNNGAKLVSYEFEVALQQERVRR